MADVPPVPPVAQATTGQRDLSRTGFPVHDLTDIHTIPPDRTQGPPLLPYKASPKSRGPDVRNSANSVSGLGQGIGRAEVADVRNMGEAYLKKSVKGAKKRVFRSSFA